MDRTRSIIPEFGAFGPLWFKWSAFITHVLFGQLGQPQGAREVGLALVDRLDAPCIVYADRGVTEEMSHAIAHALARNRKVYYRFLDDAPPAV